MLAHELRNPLAPIQNAASLLSKGNLSQEHLASVSAVLSRQVGHMTRLLDDLLDASRVTSGKVQLKKRPSSIKNAIEQAVEQCNRLIDAQGHHLTISMPQEPCFVNADPVRLIQILANLINNAAKYTPPGGRIEINACTGNDDVRITIADNGVGISPDALPHIFDVFQQERRSLDRSQGGLGLGLTIVRSMVELHDGHIDAKSDGLGLGSEFTVTIPLVFAPPCLDPDPKDSKLPALDILLVDDNADARSTLCSLFEMAGHRPLTAADGPAALKTFSQYRMDVVICDIGLPGLSGYDVARSMREHAKDRKVLLVALTGFSGPGRKERATASGFDCQLGKPASFSEILDVIKNSGMFELSNPG